MTVRYGMQGPQQPRRRVQQVQPQQQQPPQNTPRSHEQRNMGPWGNTGGRRTIGQNPTPPPPRTPPPMGYRPRPSGVASSGPVQHDPGYWTPERMQEAQPAPMPQVQNPRTPPGLPYWEDGIPNNNPNGPQNQPPFQHPGPYYPPQHGGNMGLGGPQESQGIPMGPNHPAFGGGGGPPFRRAPQGGAIGPTQDPHMTREEWVAGLRAGGITPAPGGPNGAAGTWNPYFPSASGAAWPPAKRNVSSPSLRPKGPWGLGRGMGAGGFDGRVGVTGGPAQLGARPGVAGTVPQGQPPAGGVPAGGPNGATTTGSPPTNPYAPPPGWQPGTPLPVGWAQLGEGPNAMFVRGWNEMTPEQRTALTQHSNPYLNDAFKTPLDSVGLPAWNQPAQGNPGQEPSPFMQPNPRGQYPPGYGGRIDAPPGSVHTQDFRDSDGDGHDDRYQPGPGIPPPDAQNARLQRQYDRRLANGYAGNKFLQQNPGFTPQQQQQMAEQMQQQPRGDINWMGGQEQGQQRALDMDFSQFRADPEILGLPNSPEFMRIEMELEDELSRALTEIGVARDQIPAMVEQYKARFQTDTALRERGTTQEMASRGLMGSSIASRAEFEAEIPESRQWRDYLMDVQGTYDNLAQQELEARLGYRRGRENALYDYAQGLHDDPPSSIYAGNTDYYDQGGGDEPFWDGDEGYVGDYRDFEQPRAPGWYDGPKAKTVKPKAKVKPKNRQTKKKNQQKSRRRSKKKGKK